MRYFVVEKGTDFNLGEECEYVSMFSSEEDAENYILSVIDDPAANGTIWLNDHIRDYDGYSSCEDTIYDACSSSNWTYQFSISIIGGPGIKYRKEVQFS